MLTATKLFRGWALDTKSIRPRDEAKILEHTGFEDAIRSSTPQDIVDLANGSAIGTHHLWHIGPGAVGTDESIAKLTHHSSHRPVVNVRVSPVEIAERFLEPPLT